MTTYCQLKEDNYNEENIEYKIEENNQQSIDLTCTWTTIVLKLNKKCIILILVPNKAFDLHDRVT